MDQLEDNQTFLFPFQPYEIQKKLMSDIFRVLESGGVGIFQSPTGTGKTMSILCSTIKWLKMYTKKMRTDPVKFLREVHIDDNQPKNEIPVEIDDPTELWMLEHDKKLYEVDLNNEAQKLLDEIKVSDDTIERLKSRKTGNLNQAELPQKRLKLSKKQPESSMKPVLPRIFYCTRTHSQISQLIDQIKKSPYANDVSACILSSRKHYCINSDVRKGNPSYTVLNDRCRELREGKGCCYISEDVEDLTGHILSSLMDMDETILIAKQIHRCPYYAQIGTLNHADIVCLTYGSMMNEEARKNLGIEFSSHDIVVIDEAHNLVDAINSLHTVHIQSNNVQSFLRLLNQYDEKYRDRLAPRNLLLLSQLTQICSSIHECKRFSPIMSLSDFVFKAGLENFNILKVLNFAKEHSLVQKLQMFKNHVISNTHVSAESSAPLQSVHDIQQVLRFVETLSFADKDGTIFYYQSQDLENATSEFSLKYVHLNPGMLFTSITKNVRSIVIAGGTLEPMYHLENFLYDADVKPKRISKFSYNHIVPPENIVCSLVSAGPSSQEFEFKYANKENNDRMVRELGSFMLSCANIIPHGCVVFFSSYNFLESVIKIWKECGIYDKLDRRKSIFIEKRENCDCASLFESYQKAIIEKPHSSGAILLSVVNGRLSEGINFSDNLARAVIVVGMPYANVQDPEFQEKMRKMCQNKPDLEREYLLNQCMSSVNQAIGRAIRHKDDYAALILLDKRYHLPDTYSRLPQWIRNQIQIHDKFGPFYKSLVQFYSKFVGKKQNILK